jgi:hypothetical protein
MIDPITRLRRAIHLNDLSLLKRIVRIHPSTLESRDLTDDGNTPLHLAAKLGVVEIAVRVFLLLRSIRCSELFGTFLLACLLVCWFVGFLS